jgi:hypothetical protein
MQKTHELSLVRTARSWRKKQYSLSTSQRLDIVKLITLGWRHDAIATQVKCAPAIKFTRELGPWN